MVSNDIMGISIREYLIRMGLNPVRENNQKGMFLSPFRKETTASLSVNYVKNLWFDHGLSLGGNIVNLVSRLEGCSFAKAAQRLEEGSFSFYRKDISMPEKRESEIVIRKIQPLANPALLEYLKERRISTDIAKANCEEVYYSVNDKPYFAIGFKNDAGGYELRSKYFKGCTSKDITSHTSGQSSCQLFEGFMDYLSFLTIKNWQRSPVDTIVLNSLVNLPKVENRLAGYKSVALFLDNDEAGKRAVQSLRSVCKEVIDQSAHYAKYKDLNDYLCNRSVPRQTIIKKPGRGLRM
ncbi:hypothetical protein M2480_001299 [Parabacteroides sp. PFB2-12]|uniref:toprim domain-containing protein n=1 Tax=unclassified Parabacteroides TaxID=2649774 RepID=UPI002474009F|nr:MULTISPECIES: toprim domain-containing protein [unclassified Parabacteroides]MDH6343310.1 hypothetical protein [Parabacteroides sp. PM6-13]MDH6390326.1 hypothetical protein [Parabacteroides sp. PFB2-12]